MQKTMALIMFGASISGIATAQQNLEFVGDFESGVIQKADQSHDGFYVRTLPINQVGAAAIDSGGGGFGPSANSDTRVMPREVVGTEVVSPRNGEFFARSALYINKEYEGLNSDGGKDKPRSSISMSHAAHHVDYDTETFLGFSIYVPLNYEHETGTRNPAGAVQLLSVKEPATASRGFFVLEQYVPSDGTKAHWYFRFSTNANSTLQDGGVITKIDLGPVDADLGKWTDFVIRFRENPFSVDTNPNARGIPNSKNQMFDGNKGIMQVWKAEGPANGDGNRNMVLKIDRVNAPVGLVPHASDRRAVSLRIYKYGWKENSTNVRGPVWFGFDEIRLGLAAQGAGYSDVVPAGSACSGNCVKPAAKPKPPAAVDVS